MLKRNTLAMTAIVMLIGLQLVGVTYGRWGAGMSISTTVQTGTVEVVFENIMTEDWVLAGDGSRYARSEGDFAALFQTVSCTASMDMAVLAMDFDADEDGELQPIDEELGLNINGVYPGYGCMITFDVRSAGTVPVGVAFNENHPHPLVSEFKCNGVNANSRSFLLAEGDMISCHIEVQAPLDGSVLAESASYPLSYVVLAEPYSGP